MKKRVSLPDILKQVRDDWHRFFEALRKDLSPDPKVKRRFELIRAYRQTYIPPFMFRVEEEDKRNVAEEKRREYLRATYREEFDEDIEDYFRGG